MFVNRNLCLFLKFYYKCFFVYSFTEVVLIWFGYKKFSIMLNTDQCDYAAMVTPASVTISTTLAMSLSSFSLAFRAWNTPSTPPG